MAQMVRSTFSAALRVIAGAGIASGCVSVRPPPLAQVAPRRLGASETEERRLAARRIEAWRRRGGRARALAAGVVAARAVAAGAVALQRDAESALEAAVAGYGLASEAGARAARVLVRLYNLRAMRLDFSRAPAQATLYEALARRVRARGGDPVRYAALARLARAQADYAANRRLRAYAGVRRVERDLRRHLRTYPHDEDTRTLLANHLVTMAVLLPLGRRRRLAWAAAELRHQQAHWSGLSPRARSRAVAPGVRTVFALWYAEVEAATGNTARAERAFSLVSDLGARPGATVAERQLARFARHGWTWAGSGAAWRAGGSAVLPFGVPSCVACHARETEVPALGEAGREGEG